MTSLALLVGIDHYPRAPLTGCVNDATRMEALLRTHHDGSPNFHCRSLVSSQMDVTRPVLRKEVEGLFAKPADVALFFFAGHGTANNLGGHLVTRDAERYDEGVPMGDVLTMANASKARERIILLDCCNSGAFGQVPEVDNRQAVLAEGVSVLTACRDTETASEVGGGGLFTTRTCEALEGGAADVCGKVTVASLYAYLDEVLTGWEQRPLFKAHVSKLVSLRNCAPAVRLPVLRSLPKYFAAPTSDFPLDPSYEPDAEPSHPEHEAMFRDLQDMNRARLVEPVGAEHMYYAAVHSKACRLTPLGRFYWNRVKSGKI